MRNANPTVTHGAVPDVRATALAPNESLLSVPQARSLTGTH